VWPCEKDGEGGEVDGRHETEEKGGSPLTSQRDLMISLGWAMTAGGTIHVGCWVHMLLRNHGLFTYRAVDVTS